MTNTPLDATHDPSRRSWVESANNPATDFPIQNLPFGVFRRERGGSRIGVAIGTEILDLAACADVGLLDALPTDVQAALETDSLNAFLALGANAWRETRVAIADLLDVDTVRLHEDASLSKRVLVSQSAVTMERPAVIGDYTDFYCSIHHATNVGSMFRPDNPLLPNYKHLPIGYHGRASSIGVSPAEVIRPCGQIVPKDAETPVFAPSHLLDYELEMGFLVGPGNDLGTRLTMEDVENQIFGLVIVNDWSARDIQKWEYQPLGPFNAKNFATTISPWVVTLDALAPFRVAPPERGAADPPVLAYLAGGPADLGLDITLEVSLRSAAMRDNDRPADRISLGTFRDMYWTIGQMLVHHSSTGCNLRPGDLIASGTVSGPEASSRGCLLERTWRGQEPITLSDGTTRTFLADDDEVIMTGWCEHPDTRRIGFGACTGVVQPARVEAAAGTTGRQPRSGVRGR